MEKKHYLIVGGSGGIGRATALLLARAGHDVLATYHMHPQDDQDHLRYVPLDLAAPDFTFLPSKLDGLLFCPGRVALRPFARIAPEDFLDDFAFQAGGFVRVLQAALPALKASGAGSVVAFSTVAVQRGFTVHSLVAASKGAIEGLTRSLAAELAPVVRVNCVAPSITETGLTAALLGSPDKVAANAARHPLKRVGRAEDSAAMAAFLLGPESSWITGQVMAVDGGLSL